MIDASSYPYEENVKRTATIAALAHQKGICVEGELGHVGQAGDGDNSKVDLYTLFLSIFLNYSMLISKSRSTTSSS